MRPRKRTVGFGLVGGLVAMVCGGSVTGQVVPRPVEGAIVLEQESESCSGCRLEPVQEVVLGGGGEEYGGVGSGYVYLDGRGRFLRVNRIVPSTLLVFDGRGRYVRSFGRRGRGPGEFMYPRRIVIGRGDTLHFFDEGPGRLTTVTPELEPVGSYNLGFPVFDVVQIEPGLFIANAHLNTADRFGHPFHPIRDGELGPPFGGTEAVAEVGRPRIVVWRLRLSEPEAPSARE